MAVHSDVGIQQETTECHALRAVDRAIVELRRGTAVLVQEGSKRVMVLAAEAARQDAIDQLKQAAHPSDAQALRIIVTGQRARVLGLTDNPGQACAITHPGGVDLTTTEFLADPCVDGPRPSGCEGLEITSASKLEQACLTLMKLGRLLPAAVVVETNAEPADIVMVDAADIVSYQKTAALALHIVSEARVPLEDAENARVIAFRPADGGTEHLAIVVGDIDPDAPVLTRIHSECFTGDLLGSLRCDCGSQLRGAIAEMGRAGSGIVLYLAQEGRGIGLINKLRAYQLQDAGFDTVDANLQLGFDEDERVYLPAARMLQLLGVPRVRLMTNNPIKVGALTRHGVEVIERVPHIFPSNVHNKGYLHTKATKGGHLF